MNHEKVGYVDGFVMVVPTNKEKAYLEMAEVGAQVWMKHGALDYKECIGDDIVAAEEMGMLGFSKLTNLKANETVWFSYIGYKSKAHRDEVNAKVMIEMEELYSDMESPFEMERMSWGGFEVKVSG
ncbi:DUF1428 domain-containing protein [bacterium]|nr:DUF1428 domain-containing protein [bacterium]NCQ55114.1 DUF1428 domain-containing protein [Candidatus Parcubacteria bacterium]NCS67373.1 DUF1428 domain-containing protein [Candidatus Peregrinibacteria bacterium]NCS96628.1 DUF1428 domain-containing protein [bacterium]